MGDVLHALYLFKGEHSSVHTYEGTRRRRLEPQTPGAFERLVAARFHVFTGCFFMHRPVQSRPTASCRRWTACNITASPTSTRSRFNLVPSSAHALWVTTHVDELQFIASVASAAEDGPPGTRDDHLPSTPIHSPDTTGLTHVPCCHTLRRVFEPVC